VIGKVRTQRFVARIDRAPLPGTPTQHELAAANALQAASAALGRAQTDLLLMVLVDDLPWTTVARQTKVDRHTVVERTRRALEALVGVIR
jgi:DNA-directed RNA polymerase specialized sigma24 family protein